MKVAVVQPYYSMESADLEKCFSSFLELCDRCDPSLDLIVFPEYCDIPACVRKEAFHRSIAEHNEKVREKISETAARCGALVFANFADITPTGPVNTTFAFDRNGKIIGKYKKAHPAPSEYKTFEEGGNGVECSYADTPDEPYILEADGVRYAFLTCYDFYITEMIPRLAKAKPDVIIGCSHQRTDTHSALEIIARYLTYNTNAYLIRSSVSLGKDSPVCGCSMIAAPDGSIISDIKNEVGIASAEIDVKKKYYKPAGFGGAPASHFEYAEKGRRPWLYRPAGGMIIPSDDMLLYPRICAHRGFNTIAPENSMPAFGAAVALGADEIEFDIWSSLDGTLVSMHDRTLDRVSDGTGFVYETPFEELKKLDFGAKRGPHFAGLGIVTFEEILKKFSCSVIMNIHVKIWDRPELDHRYEEIAHLIRKYDCADHVYMMSSSDSSLREFRKIAPDIHICVGFARNKTDFSAIVRRAVALGAEKVQLFKPYFDQSTVDYAKAEGLICNVFYADDPEEAKRYIEMGIDTILTNDFLSVRNALAPLIASRKHRHAFNI